MTRLVALVACAMLACESSSGGGGNDLGVPVASSGSGVTKPKPSFADDIAKQITGETPAPGAEGQTPASMAAGSAAAGSAAAGSAAAGSAAPGTAAPAGSAKGSAAAPAGSAKPAEAVAKPGSAAPAGSAKPVVIATPPTGSAAPGSAAVKPNVQRGVTAALKLPPQTPGELAKIRLSLGPNWQRDTEGAGTLSFALTEPAKGQIVLFLFEYGYEVESAPVEREAYKKWLVDNKVLTNVVDRQRGVSWYIEGTDAGGRPAFRYVAQFGPKKLVCGGSLYRDAEGNRLGDLRDEIVLRAKQICETVAL